MCDFDGKVEISGVGTGADLFVDEKIVTPLSNRLQDIQYAINGDESDSVVESIAALAKSAASIANAIADQSAWPGEDETGGKVRCLTEAVMGVTAGLCRVAESISDLAEAVRTAK
mgnify:CR=1 FL=1